MFCHEYVQECHENSICQKKEKVDKRDLAENNTFFCDTCDRGFKTQEKYQEHVDGHMKVKTFLHQNSSFAAMNINFSKIGL